MRPHQRGAHVGQDAGGLLDELRVGRHHAALEIEVVLKPHAHVATRKRRGGNIGHLVSAKAEGRPGPAFGDVVHHRHEGVHVARRAPRDAHAELHQRRIVEHAFLHQLLGEPQVAGVESLDLGLHAKLGHHPAHGAQHLGGVGHHVGAVTEVHRAAVEGADLGQTVADMRHALGCARHVGIGTVELHRGLDITEGQVTAGAGGQVQHHIHLGRADAVGHLAKQRPVAAGRAGLGIADVAMHHRRTGLGGIDSGLGDLGRRARHEPALVLRGARAGDGGGDEGLAVHLEGHRISLPAFPDRVTFLGEGAGAFLLVLGAVEPLDGLELAAIDAVEHVLELHVLGLAGDLLDRGKDQRRAGGEFVRHLARLGHQVRGGQDTVDQAPAMRLLGVEPAPGKKQLHRDVVGDALGQLDRRGIGHGAGLDLRQGKAGMIGGEDDVGAERQLEPAAAGDAVDGGDHRLVQAAQFLQPAEAADAVIGIRRLALGRGLQIPARAEELLALRGEDCHAQRGIVAEFGEDLAQLAARRHVDGVGLGPVQGDFKHRTAARRQDVLGHSSILIRASAATASVARQISGLISISCRALALSCTSVCRAMAVSMIASMSAPGRPR
ncbi:hypothetical protein R2601_02548 [Salipiger bermudensis HTCC2601]|uniref:Uncharacterized protein n=1 Tax=Salipiger bermudensis (strain DSM 26914 / JCM 13377 / KCTC 12554 / HTCC2601) TaxID=314265 RepID=Q0FWY6_SALBH|nr:hypothetical protein R2601_02548 [Salipiger bermudensis HTCC2601]